MAITVRDLDKADAWAGDGGAIPIGTWITEIDNVEEGFSSNKSPQLEITWRVVEGELTGATSREWLVVLPQTYGKVKAFLEAVGWHVQPGEFALPTRELVGRRARTVWRAELYAGKSTIKCNGHSPVPVAVGGEVPIDTSDLDEPLPF